MVSRSVSGVVGSTILAHCSSVAWELAVGLGPRGAPPSDSAGELGTSASALALMESRRASDSEKRNSWRVRHR